MTRKWSYRTSIDFCRHADDFPRYPDAIPDPDASISKWFQALQIQPVNAREWKCLTRWEVGPRTLQDSFWFCFPKGRGSVTLDNGRLSFRFLPGDLILIPKGTPHHVRLDDQPQTHLLVVHFHANLFGNINLLDLLGFPWHVPASAGAPFERISNEIIHEFMRHPPGWSSGISARIMELLLHLTRHHGRGFRRPPNEISHKNLLRLMPALELIETQFANPHLTVAGMSRSLSVSEVHFRKLLRSLTGLSPIALLRRHRVQHASVLLRTTSLSIKQIAGQSGFNDLPFFYRVFRQATGQTPGAYRRTQEI